MSNIVLAQAAKLAKTLGMDGGGQELIQTLKATAFKGQVSDSQMAALLLVANQYELSPWTREIYAFPDKNNGIVPVVGVDGWSRIINKHPQFDGLEFEQSENECTCIIHRKDRSKPTKVTEFKDECIRNTGPWESHPRRMLRHKALIQCARLAFGYTGIYDQDEAERIVDGTVIDGGTGEIINGSRLQDKQLPTWPDDAFAARLAKWRNGGTLSPDELIARLSTKGVLSEAQKAEINRGRLISGTATTTEQGPAMTFAQVEEKLRRAGDIDVLDVAADFIREVADQQQRAELQSLYTTRRAELADQ